MGLQPNLSVRCPRCEGFVTGTDHGSFQFSEEGDDVIRHGLLCCPDCAQPFLVQHKGLWEHSEGHSYVVWKSPSVLYPADPITIDSSVPRQIAASFLEAQVVASQCSAHTSAAIMCRRTLEGICKHFNAEGRTLKDKLAWLKDQGTIEPRIHEWADEVLRGLGNDAAHDVDQGIAREDAQAALDFTKAIIEYLFVFQAAFDRFRARRDGAKKNGAQK